MTPHPAGPYSTYRLFEWYSSVTMLLMALTLALPGDTLERGALKPIAQMGVSEESLAVFFTCIGAVRCLALYLNGHINNFRVGPKGAFIRASCATLGCLIYSQFTMALIFDAVFRSNAPALNIAVFGATAGFEALSVYIAVQDAQMRNNRLANAVELLRGMDG
jgi:hypothetical protein